MELGARLRAFAGFVRRGSFSGAAEDLRISQPAVSKHIAEMERQLGVKLIERRSRALTTAGEFRAVHVLREGALLRRHASLPTMRSPILVSCRSAGSPCRPGRRSRSRCGAAMELPASAGWP